VTTLKKGDRVRITALIRVPGYQPGDKGTVIWAWGAKCLAGGKGGYYVVGMDKNPTPGGATFFPDEIEPDV
jgi:hypothetical protein